MTFTYKAAAIVSTILLTFVLSCSNGQSIDKTVLYSKIADYMEKYSNDDFYEYYERKEAYPLEDSLCFYLSQLNPESLIRDNEFRALAGKMLERMYLTVRNSGLTPPKAFPAYNMSIVVYPKRSNMFALNIIMKEQRNINEGFEIYANTGREFVCIDSVVLRLDKIPEMQTDSIHRICKKLVEDNETGGCRW